MTRIVSGSQRLGLTRVSIPFLVGTDDYMFAIVRWSLAYRFISAPGRCCVRLCAGLGIVVPDDVVLAASVSLVHALFVLIVSHVRS